MHIVSLNPIFEQIVNPILQDLLQGFVIFVAGWVMWAFHKYAAPYVGAQLEAKASADLNQALQNGVWIAMQKVEGAEKANADIQVKGQIAAWAAQYAIDHTPGAVSHFGLSPDELATKALAYLPTPPTATDTTGAKVTVQPVTVAPLAPVK